MVTKTCLLLLVFSALVIAFALCVSILHPGADDVERADGLHQADVVVASSDEAGALAGRLSVPVLIRDPLDDFDVVKGLGKGFDGKAMLVRGRSDPSKLAVLKLFASAISQESRAREALSLDQLRHVPGVAHLKAVYPVNDRIWYLLIDYVDGIRLADLLKMDREELPAGFSLERLIRNLYETAHSVHRAGIVHNDLHDENVLLTRDSDFTKPVLIDCTVCLPKDFFVSLGLDGQYMANNAVKLVDKFGTDAGVDEMARLLGNREAAIAVHQNAPVSAVWALLANSESKV